MLRAWEAEVCGGVEEGFGGGAGPGVDGEEIGFCFEKRWEVVWEGG